MTQFLKHFPEEQIVFAFTYGSKVFGNLSRVESVKSRKMLDFIFVVKNDFHRMNLIMNPHHYSYFPRFLGHSFVNKVQSRFGGLMYYNSYVIVDSELIKYGTIFLEDFHRDLTSWDTFFVAGRMQKPINIIKDTFLTSSSTSSTSTSDLLVGASNDGIRETNSRLCENIFSKAITRNLQRAFLLALNNQILASNSSRWRSARTTCSVTDFKILEETLYEEIASLSYKGDIRVILRAEDPMKVKKIVRNSFKEFRELYSPFILKYLRPETSKGSTSIANTATYHVSSSSSSSLSPMEEEETRPRVFQILDDELLKTDTMELFFDRPSNDNGTIAVPQKEENYHRMIFKMNEHLRRKILWTSLTQTLKGFLSSGFSKSFQYAKSKRSAFNNNNSF